MAFLVLLSVAGLRVRKTEGVTDMSKYFIKMLVAYTALALSARGASSKKKNPADGSAKIAQGTLWVEPSDIQSRDLFYGRGGKEHQPSGTKFTFVDEDLDGSNPKYNVKAEDGVKWKIKLGA